MDKDRFPNSSAVFPVVSYLYRTAARTDDAVEAISEPR